MDEEIEQPTFYDRVGGMPFFERLVGRFYECVVADPVLLNLYPDQVDIGPARERLTLFLVQYWGGPLTYLEMRGHPRLRARHFPFTIGEVERDHWLAAMADAIETIGVPEPERTELWKYCTMAAEAMRNDGLRIVSDSTGR